MLDSSGRTHTGHKRSQNEDCFGCAPEQGLWLVADGMGGHAGGRIAAEIARDTVLAEFARHRDLEHAIQQAHAAIQEAVRSGIGAAGMGCTLVALHIQDQQFNIAWAGDARAYLWDGELHQLTRDHSRVQSMVDSGLLAPEQAQHHPDRNIVTQALGDTGMERVENGRVTGRLQPGDALLLCSDGLNDELCSEDIAALLAAGGGSALQAERLIGAALASGGRDNVTAVVVNYPDHGADTASTTSAAVAAHRTPWQAASLGVLACILAVVATAWWLDIWP